MALDRDAIVLAALELLNDIGLDNFTTRRLAERLGVKQPAIYWHFRSKRDLLDEMAAQMLPVYRPSNSIASDDWMNALKADAHFFREALLRYRDGARVHAGTRPYPRVYPSLDRRVRVMRDAGFSAEDALRAMMVISHFVVGSVIEEQSSVDAARSQTDAGSAMNADAYPDLTRGMSLIESGDPAMWFEYGLDAMVGGIVANKNDDARDKSRDSNS